MSQRVFVSVIIPAMDEENAIGKVVKELVELSDESGRVISEIIVCDNGSTDNTRDNALKAGAKVVSQPIPGYGIACLTALGEVSPLCEVILFVDGDYSSNTQQALRLLSGIEKGDDLAIGSRTLGNIEKGALTPAQRFGNWLAAKLIRILYGKTVTDLGPFRAVKKPALDKLKMRDKTFGWTVEMQVKAIKEGMQVSEYPVDSTVRIGQSKISGTIKGTVLAGVGIISTIFKLYF